MLSGRNLQRHASGNETRHLRPSGGSHFTPSRSVPDFTLLTRTGANLWIRSRQQVCKVRRLSLTARRPAGSVRLLWVRLQPVP